MQTKGIVPRWRGRIRLRYVGKQTTWQGEKQETESLECSSQLGYTPNHANYQLSQETFPRSVNWLWEHLNFMEPKLARRFKCHIIVNQIIRVTIANRGKLTCSGHYSDLSLTLHDFIGLQYWACFVQFGFVRMIQKKFNPPHIMKAVHTLFVLLKF